MGRRREALLVSPLPQRGTAGDVLKEKKICDKCKKIVDGIINEKEIEREIRYVKRTKTYLPGYYIGVIPEDKAKKIAKMIRSKI